MAAAVATKVLAALLAGAALAGAPELALEDFRLGFTYLDQRGKGYQSKAGAELGGPGDEAATVISPAIFATVRQSDRVRHRIHVPVDLVTSASANGLDAISSASAVTEAFDIDVHTDIEATDDTDVDLRYGVHWEEPMRTVILGAGAAFHLAQDNAVLRLDFTEVVDIFNAYQPDGRNAGLAVRTTEGVNVGLSQLLSPTTVAWIAYGVTFQAGTLATTYNSVPVEGGGRLPEKLPDSRLRHAWSLRLAQHIPETRSTLRADYRFYTDDIGIQAHTASAQVYQYVTDRLLLEGSYRFHTQTAADFFGTVFPKGHPDPAPRTADSDLAAFEAHEIGGRLLWLVDKADWARASDTMFSAGYSRYFRPNLVIDGFSMSYATRF